MASLEFKCVGDIEGPLWVPDYQRGYRWTTQVGTLLEDICSHIREPSDEPYYLQPVVVQLDRDGKCWLVDGQQRLTTLFLVWQYMNNKDLPTSGAPYCMHYDTRPDTADYLRDPDPQHKQKTIDFFHIHGAYEQIREWFETAAADGDLEGFAERVEKVLREQVQVIWYEAPTDIDGAELFARLNVGRIPLTSAELVKALLLSRIEGDDRIAETAAEWDAIERDLSDPELWAFLTGTDGSEDATRIDLLLDTIADSMPDQARSTDRDPYRTFGVLRACIESSPSSPSEFWDRVVGRYSRLRAWCDDRSLFHKIGFLAATEPRRRPSSRPRPLLSDLIKFAESHTRGEFDDELTRRIRERLNLSEQELRELSYDDDDKAKLVLLLMNVETMRRRDDPGERFSFRMYARETWSLEHIQARHEETWTDEQRRQFLHGHQETITQLDEACLSTRIEEALGATNVPSDELRRLADEVTDRISKTADVDVDDLSSIGNLALLARRDNSAFNNRAFADKRRRLLRREQRDSYIPICTRDAFLKVYTVTEEPQLRLWNHHDLKDYVDKIVDTLDPYLRTGDGSSAE